MRLKHKTTLVAAALFLVSGWVSPSFASMDIPSTLAAHAKITLAQARAKAQKAFPGGKIVKEELERERGGSGVRYSFDMRRGKVWREVGIDAKTGKVLENSKESANPTD